MREIKFRAWDKNTKKIIIDLPMVICYKAFWLYDELNNAMEYYGHGNDYILMQYTGLKDKNGKEIYEGDIIQFPEIIPLTVGYEKGSFVWGNLAPFITIREKLEEMPGKVIGNIYENPDLLEP